MESKFKDIPISQRPREKALKYGISNLSDTELLAIVLRCGSKKKDVMEISKELLNKFIDFNRIINCSLNELLKIESINKIKAIEIQAIMEIAKRAQRNKICNVKKINTPEDIHKYFSFLIENKTQEVFVVIFLNVKNHIIKYEELFMGGIDCSIIDVKLIFKNAFNCGASKIICMHNHPSGDPSPSNQDLLITKKIMNLGEVLDIKLLDHLIIGKNSYISLKKERYI